MSSALSDWLIRHAARRAPVDLSDRLAEEWQADCGARSTALSQLRFAIDFDGTLSWNGHSVDRRTLQGYITEQAGETPQPEVHIAVDKYAQYSKVAETLADLQSRGLSKIGFINNGFP